MNAGTILLSAPSGAARSGAKTAARSGGGADAFQGALDAQSEQLRSPAPQPAAPRQEQRPADASVQNGPADRPASAGDAAEGGTRRAGRHEPRSTEADAQQAVPGAATDPQLMAPPPQAAAVTAPTDDASAPHTTDPSTPDASALGVPQATAQLSVPGPPVTNGQPQSSAAPTAPAPSAAPAPGVGPAPFTALGPVGQAAPDPASAAVPVSATAAAPVTAAAPDTAATPAAAVSSPDATAAAASPVGTPAAAAATAQVAAPGVRIVSTASPQAPAARPSAAGQHRSNAAASAPVAVASVTQDPADLLAGMRIRAAGRATAGDTGDAAPATGPTADASAAPPVGAPTPAAPVQQPAATPVAAVAPAAPVTPADSAEPTLAAQLVPPIAALAARGNGEHVVTVRVSPENLGAVTVRAHVVAGSMKVELFAAAPHARDALSAMLPDLRRDLAGTEGTGSTTVGLGGEASARSDTRGSGSERGSAGSGRPSAAPSAAPAPASTARSPWRPAPAAGRLDVLA